MVPSVVAAAVLLQDQPDMLSVKSQPLCSADDVRSRIDPFGDAPQYQNDCPFVLIGGRTAGLDEPAKAIGKLGVRVALDRRRCRTCGGIS
jgi:hypothetical protein